MNTAPLPALALLLAVAATPAAAGVLLFDGGGKVTGITDLDVGTATYDVAFRSGTFTSVFGLSPDFTTNAAAATARTAVNAALNSSGIPAPFLALTDPIDNIDDSLNSYYVPFNANTTTVRSVAAIYAGLYGTVGGPFGFSPATQTAVWADFTVVPLPGAALVLATALAGLWGLRRLQYGSGPIAV